MVTLSQREFPVISVGGRTYVRLIICFGAILCCSLSNKIYKIKLQLDILFPFLRMISFALQMLTSLPCFSAFTHMPWPPHYSQSQTVLAPTFDNHWPFTLRPSRPEPLLLRFCLFRLLPTMNGTTKAFPKNSAWFVGLSLLAYSKVSPQPSHLIHHHFTTRFPSDFVIAPRAHAFPAHPSFRSGPNFRNHRGYLCRAFIPFWDKYATMPLMRMAVCFGGWIHSERSHTH